MGINAKSKTNTSSARALFFSFSCTNSVPNAMYLAFSSASLHCEKKNSWKHGTCFLIAHQLEPFQWTVHFTNGFHVMGHIVCDNTASSLNGHNLFLLKGKKLKFQPQGKRTHHLQKQIHIRFYHLVQLCAGFFFRTLGERSTVSAAPCRWRGVQDVKRNLAWFHGIRPTRQLQYPTQNIQTWPLCILAQVLFCA